MDGRIYINQDAQKHIQAYIDYNRIVGMDDGGKMMTDKEFEAYKKKVAEARKNHLYVYWVNCKNYDCKAIGPESMCFCGHRYKQHNFDNVKTKKVTCKVAKCKCPLYDYIPVYGSNDVKCLCKHSYSLHDNVTRKCGKCTQCNHFGSKFTCNCGYGYDDHQTTIESREERIAHGKAVDPSWMQDNLTAGIGGLNSFSGMVKDAYAEEYAELIEGDVRKQLPGEIGKNKSGNLLTDAVSALDLFNTPHKYSKMIGDESINKLSTKFNKMSLYK